jgi:cation:H+ antiporter
MPILQLALLILGFFMLVKGADWLVDGCSGIAAKSGIPQIVIGLTIVAMGTSAPEAAVSITAALKENADIAIGNIVGSNIFNILFVIGTSALIAPITFDSQFFVDGILAILSSAALWLFALRTKTLRRSGGLLMLLGYAAYFIYLIK